MHPFVKLFRTLSVFLIIGLLANHADHDEHADPNTSMFWFSALFLKKIQLFGCLVFLTNSLFVS